MAARGETTRINKANMLKALEVTLGVVSRAAKMARVSIPSHYNYLRDDEVYREAVHSIRELQIDFVENALFKSIRNGSDTAIIFYLKSKGASRGYGIPIEIPTKEKEEKEETVTIGFEEVDDADKDKT